jgi:hypothetical protein
MLRDLEARAMGPLAWYWLDAGFGCGGVGVDAAGIIREAAPIFRRLVGQALKAVVARGRYRAERLRE